MKSGRQAGIPPSSQAQAPLEEEVTLSQRHAEVTLYPYLEFEDPKNLRPPEEALHTR